MDEGQEEAQQHHHKEATTDHVKVAPEGASLDVNRLIQLVGNPGAGAIATFVGVTRDNFQGKAVVRLEYEGYVPMAEKVMQSICKEVRIEISTSLVLFFKKLINNLLLTYDVFHLSIRHPL